jgi:hypothetical protein
MGGLNSGAGALGPQQVTGVRSSGAPPVTGQVPTGQPTGGVPGLTGLPGQGAGGMYGPPPWLNNFLQMLVAARQAGPQGGTGQAVNPTDAANFGNQAGGVAGLAGGTNPQEAQQLQQQFGPGNRSQGWLANRGPGGAVTNRMQLNQFGQPVFNAGGGGVSGIVGPGGEWAPRQTTAQAPPQDDMAEAQRRVDAAAAENEKNRQFSNAGGLPDVGAKIQPMPGPFTNTGPMKPTGPTQSTVANPSGLAATNPLAAQMNAAFRGSGQVPLPPPPPVAPRLPAGSTSNFDPRTGMYTNVPSPNMPAPVPTQIRRGAAQPIF